MTVTPFRPLRQLEVAAADPYFEALATWLVGKLVDTLCSCFEKKAPEWEEKVDSTMAKHQRAASSYYCYLKPPRPDGRPLHEHNLGDGVERTDPEIGHYK